MEKHIVGKKFKLSCIVYPQDENEREEGKHFEVMSQIVDDNQEQGLPDLARNLEFEPGTLSIFQGNQCLHRVTKCKGPTDRLVAVLCFSTRQGVRNSPKVQEMFWGRTSSEATCDL